MIAIDTSSFVAYLAGEQGNDIEQVDLALEHNQGVFPPVVLSELLSDSRLSEKVERLLKEIPLLALMEGYWERSGKLRSKILAKGLKARLADSLIAQSCLDHHVPLITRDSDFRHFLKYTNLHLL